MANTIIKPILFSREVQRKRDIKNVFYNYVNTAFTGELKRAGDTVTVQLLPTLSFVAGTAGDPITKSDFTITSENLVIDQTRQLAVIIKDIEATQSNLALMQKVADRFAEAEARLFDETVRDTILNDTNVTRLNDTDDNGSGVNGVTIDKTNVFAEIEKMVVALAENNVTDNLVLFVSPKVASVLRQSGLLNNTDMWLEARQKGYIWLISGVKVVISNALTVSQKMIMMEKGAVNFVAQLNKVKVTDWNDGFYSNLLAEIVYGTKIFSEAAKWIVVNVVETVNA